jgi:hypothetical protein
MFRGIAKILLLSVLVVAGSVGIYLYRDHFSASRDIRRLEEEKKELQQIVQRLSAESRRADVLVTDQKTIDGVLNTTLLFVEYDRNEVALPAKRFTVKGDFIHIDAMVIKFERGFIEENDPLRGHSIALFTKIYGDAERPADAAMIDPPNEIPGIYRDADPRVSEFEMQLWKNFWKLAEDPKLRAERGVRIANGQGVWGPFEINRLYTLTIESDGGLNLVYEPIKGIYQEALKNHAETR